MRTTEKLLKLLILLLATGSLCGCHTFGGHTGDQAATSMREATTAVQSESQALQAVTLRLDDLVNHPANDLKPQFKLYSDALDHLETSADRADKAAKHMHKQSNAYFAEWDKQLEKMSFEAIRARSQARKVAVSNQVESVSVRYHDTQSVMRPVIGYFQDIEKSLSTDLTLGGLSTTKEVVVKSSENTDKLQKALEMLSSELANSSSQLSSFVASSPKSGELQPTGQIAVPQVQAAR